MFYRSGQVAGDYAVTDYVPAVGPIGVLMRLPSPLGRVTLEPEGTELRGSWANGEWTGTVENLAIRSMVVFET